MEINEKGLQATPKEKNLVTVLELALEMCERGYSFKRIDLTDPARQNLLLKVIP